MAAINPAPNSFLTSAELSKAIETLFGIKISVNALGQQYHKGKGFPARKIGGKRLYLWGECLEEQKSTTEILNCATHYGGASRATQVAPLPDAPAC